MFLSPVVLSRLWQPALAAAALAATPAWALPGFDEVRADFRPSETLILSREGELLHRLRTDSAVRRGQWVQLADVSPALRTALVLSEDRRFYEHSGVDWRAVSAAAWGNLWNQRTRGASTLTMQLAGLLDGDWRQGPGGRSVVQKLGQTVAAKRLEQHWRKDQILEAYLNLVPFRGEVVGIDALSRTLFGKAAHGLNEREAAVAAALVRAPNARPALVAQRACGVLRAMQLGAGAGDCDALDMFTEAALQRRSWAASEGVAPHFARRLLAQRKAGEALPTQLTSTLRAPLQRFAVQTLRQHLRELQGRNVEDGAVVVLDNASGEVLAWVGSSGSLSQAAEVDGVLAPRQPGSTLKPFLYAQAIDERRLTAASLIEDSPAHIPTASGLYIPQNYDRQFKGWVSVRTALAASLNVPAVRTLVMVSPDAFFAQLQALGLPLRESGGYFGYSLALGSSEVPLLHLANAYRALANGGRYSPVAPAALAQGQARRLVGRSSSAARAGEKSHFAPIFPAVATATVLKSGHKLGSFPTPFAATSSAAQTPRPQLQRVLGENAAFIVGDILADGNARARTFGTDSVLATRFWSAVKTGTSKDMRDNWALGWSARYTVGVWVGNASGAAMHDVSGTSGAAPVWAAVMAFLHQREPSRAPAPPRALVQAPVRFGAAPGSAQALEAARSEWFVPGTQQALFAMDSGASWAGGTGRSGQKGLKPSGGDPARSPVRITAPADGTIVALDPDIPPDRQRLQFTAAPAQPGLRWRMDGKALGQGAQLAWLPWPGRHVVQLSNARGDVLDEIRIEVRGAGVRRSD